MTAVMEACDAGGDAPAGTETTVVTGCQPSAARPATAPGGYYVNGNTLCTASGRPHLLHGVDRPSLEWNAAGVDLSPTDFATMATWRANVVRVALDQDFWLADSPRYAASYPATVDQVIQWAEEAGLDVILDLHWSDRGDYTVTPGQQQMADQHSLVFWQEVAGRYKDDGRVFFELYNEPHDIPVDVWLSGGSAGGFTAVGMQQLYDAVRGVGANNPVIVGGLDWAYDLSFVSSSPVVGYNILYATHPYNDSAERQPGEWDSHWGYLAASAPVVVTEFGDGTGDCSPAWDQELIPYADQLHVSWTAWAWWAGDCKFPALLTDWSYATTNEGAVVRSALLGYDDPAADPPADAGSSDGAADATPDVTLDDAGDDGGDDAGFDAADDAEGGSG
jgi:aryl-phospho-beta-D-glucosidase BglC (GH1 family)